MNHFVEWPSIWVCLLFVSWWDWISGFLGWCIAHWFKILPWRSCRWEGVYSWWSDPVGTVQGAQWPTGLAIIRAELWCSKLSHFTVRVEDCQQVGTKPSGGHTSQCMNLLHSAWPAADPWFMVALTMMHPYNFLTFHIKNDDYHLERAWDYTASLQWFPQLSASFVNISGEKLRSWNRRRERGEIREHPLYILWNSLKLIVPKGFLYSSLLLSPLTDRTLRSIYNS